MKNNEQISKQQLQQRRSKTNIIRWNTEIAAQKRGQCKYNKNLNNLG